MIKFITIPVSKFLLFTAVLVFASCNNSPQKETESAISLDKLNELIPLIEDGDFIIKRGKGSISKMIVKKLNEKIPFSHCGIIIRENDSIYIVHSVAKELSGKDGVQIISLKEFLDDSYNGSVKLCRLKTDKKNKESISLNAKSHLKNKVPFDYEFDYENRESFYCTELLYNSLENKLKENIFKKSNIDNKQVLTFNSFLDTTFFTVVPIN
ncbi:MAG: hypothetical protein M3Q58_08635 [Bacteroidota bacterium]|nr:hypothetical protein [Bacteroidota bacterium]